MSSNSRLWKKVLSARPEDDHDRSQMSDSRLSRGQHFIRNSAVNDNSRISQHSTNLGIAAKIREKSQSSKKQNSMRQSQLRRTPSKVDQKSQSSKGVLFQLSIPRSDSIDSTTNVNKLKRTVKSLRHTCDFLKNTVHFFEAQIKEILKLIQSNFQTVQDKLGMQLLTLQKQLSVEPALTVPKLIFTAPEMPLVPELSKGVTMTSTQLQRLQVNGDKADERFNTERSKDVIRCLTERSKSKGAEDYEKMPKVSMVAINTIISRMREHLSSD